MAGAPERSSQEDQEAFQQVGELLGQLFRRAIDHAAGASPDVAALLVQRFREGRGVRAVVSLDAGQINFEWRGNDGTWRSFVSLNGELPPELVN